MSGESVNENKEKKEMKERKMKRKVDRVLANHSLDITTSQGTSNIPFLSLFIMFQPTEGLETEKRSEFEKKTKTESSFHYFSWHFLYVTERKFRPFPHEVFLRYRNSNRNWKES